MNFQNYIAGFVSLRRDTLIYLEEARDAIDSEDQVALRKGLNLAADTYGDALKVVEEVESGYFRGRFSRLTEAKYLHFRSASRMFLDGLHSRLITTKREYERLISSNPNQQPEVLEDAA